MANNRKILYVDDDANNRAVFLASFEEEFDIEVAESGEAALRFLRQHSVAIVVSDQRMPGLAGNELLAKVKSLWPRTVRMIVTGYADVDAILRSVNDGLVARYVVKPWETDQLQQMLRWGLEAHELASEKHGMRIQARLLESERLATLGAIQMSFLHEVATLLSYITGSVAELEAFSGHTEYLLDLVDNDAKRPTQDLRQLQVLLADFPEVLDDLRTGASLLTHFRDEVCRMVIGRTSADETSANETFADEKSSCTGEEVHKAILFAITVNKTEATLASADLRYESSEQPPGVAMSFKDLMQVLINLTRNAIQSHSPQYHGNEVVIRIKSDNKKQQALLSISDNGEGMSEELLGRLGKQFHTTRETGTGLGTFRCKTLVSHAGGSLSFHSEPRKGTTAIVAVPLASKA